MSTYAPNRCEALSRSSTLLPMWWEGGWECGDRFGTLPNELDPYSLLIINPSRGPPGQYPGPFTNHFTNHGPTTVAFCMAGATLRDFRPVWDLPKCRQGQHFVTSGLTQLCNCVAFCMAGATLRDFRPVFGNVLSHLGPPKMQAGPTLGDFRLFLILSCAILARTGASQNAGRANTS